jgi:acetyl esterase/lipase
MGSIADRRSLAQSGVPVTCKRYAGMIHGFIRRPTQLDQARTALGDIAAALKARHGTRVQ